jgi:Zn-dependent protease
VFGEPGRTQGDLNFQVFGIPVRVHPFFWIFVFILGGQYSNLAAAVVWLMAAFLSVLSHELGHAMVMRRFGRQPWITLHTFGGTTEYDPGWGRGGRNVSPLGEVAISAAGPGAGFLMTAVICMVHWLTGGIMLWDWWLKIIPMPLLWVPTPALMRFLNDLILVNIVWGVFNLLPVYPLDGGHIVRELLSLVHPKKGIEWSMILSAIVAGGLAGYSLYQLGKGAQAGGRSGPVELLGSPEFFMLILFGVLAYQNVKAYQAYTGRRPWA